jgi:hypothetical protein
VDIFQDLILAWKLRLDVPYTSKGLHWVFGLTDPVMGKDLLGGQSFLGLSLEDLHQKFFSLS